MHLWLFFVYFAINKPITIEMKHFVGISLFLLALPMVAAEVPMSYVRVIEFDPLALSYPYLSPLRLLRKQPGMQRGFGWNNNESKQRCCDANCYFSHFWLFRQEM